MRSAESGPVSVECGAGTGRSRGGLRIVQERSSLGMLVRAGGTVDAANVAVWRRLVGEAAQATVCPGPLIVDTSQLDFMGACAFAALAEESVRCRGRGVRFSLVSNQSIVARVVAAVGLDTDLPLYANVVDAALDGRTPPTAATDPP